METIKIDGKIAVPTSLGTLDTAGLVKWENFFRSRALEHTPPVDLVEIGGELLTLDGHHRLALTLDFRRQIIGHVHLLGERFLLNNKLTLLPPEAIEALTYQRQLAVPAGNKTFTDMLRRTNKRIFENLIRLGIIKVT